MRKEELRAAFDRIQPREELICSTIDKMNRQRLGISRERKMPTLAFATRVAAAFCALMLVVGLGFFNIDSVITPTGEGSTLGRSADGSLQNDEGQSVAPAAYGLLGEDEMTDTARLDDGDRFVIDGELEAVYFAPISDEERASGVVYKCNAQIATALSPDTNGELPQNAAVSAQILFYDEKEANEFFASMGRSAKFHLSYEDIDGERVWRIEDVRFE